MKKSSENKTYRAIGLMSGTAMDGIDGALIETDGYDYIQRLGFSSCDHDDDLRTQLRAQLNKHNFDTDVERKFTLAQLPIIQQLLDQCSLSFNDIDAIGFHGQTTHHDPDNGITVQMGDGQLLANETGADVVYDFRTNDMKNGGQGAPLIPVYHRALLQNANVELPIAILNLGGVGNVTWVSNDEMVAFDTGPANAMIDDWVGQHTSQKFDKGGEIASRGMADENVLKQFVSLPYFDKSYPKSLDRNDFQNILVEDLPVEDGAATLTEMTVQSVAKGIDLCPSKPNAIYVTGGGRHNDYMMKRFADVMELPIHSVDDLGWNGDAMEAEGFAYMAVRSLLNEPISFPKTTGCAQAVTGGVHARSMKNRKTA